MEYKLSVKTSIIPYDLKIKSGDSFSFGVKIVCKTNFGNLVGKVLSCTESSDNELDGEFLRIASELDLAEIEEKELESERWIFEVKNALRKDERFPEIKVEKAMESLGSESLIVIFTSEEGIDFREIVSYLSQYFRKKVLVRKVGDRDATKILGGIGKCGLEICCSRFLGAFESVTSEMAHEQEISFRGVDKICGICGKLTCCIRYELPFYEEMKKIFPKIGDIVNVKRKQDEFEVVGFNLVSGKVTLKNLKTGEERVFDFSEIKR